MRQPRPQNSRLDLVEPAVDTDSDVVVALGLAVLAHEQQALRQLFVVCKHRPTVAERGEILRRVEAEAAERPDRPGVSTPECCARRLGAVLDDGDPAVGAHFENGFGVGALPVQVHRHDRAGPLAEGAAKRIRIHRPGLRLDVAQHGRRPGALDRGDRRDARVRLGDDLVAGSKLERAEGDLDRVGPGAHADCMAGPKRRGELLFERSTLGAEHEPAAREHPRQGRIQIAPHCLYAAS